MKKKYSAYSTYEDEHPWHIVILDHEWWIDDKASICLWFERNCTDIRLLYDNPIIKLSVDEYAMWQLAWS